MLPRPLSIVPGDGAFVLDAGTRIVAPAELSGVVQLLQGLLRPATASSLDASPGAGGSTGTIALAIGAVEAPIDPAEHGAPAVELEDGVRGGAAAEAYRIEVGEDLIRVTGATREGLLRGVHALVTLLPPAIHRTAPVSDASWRIPAVTIIDAPRFAWRGLMLDVARRFLPVREVRRIIDLLALLRMNVLHLHLTDDQGWRMPVERYPLLTEVGGWRSESQLGGGYDAPGDGRPHGGCYSIDDIREIVAYAAARGITVVPEIDSPGHVHAAIAAYPGLGVLGTPLEVSTRWGVDRNVLNAEESTVRFFTEVLDEVLDVFPSRFIGIGGDECPRDQWRDDPRTQERMRELGIADEAGVEAWFVRRLADHLAARGRRAFGWDEILDGEPGPGVAIAAWRGTEPAAEAARRGFDVISCPEETVYLDHRQSTLADEPIPVAGPTTLADAFAFDPVPAGLEPDEAARILGGQANLWTEHVDSARGIDYLLLPRLAGVAQALWSGADAQNSDRAPAGGAPAGGAPADGAPVDGAPADGAPADRALVDHLLRLDALGVEYRDASGPRPWQRRPGVVGRDAD